MKNLSLIQKGLSILLISGIIWSGFMSDFAEAESNPEKIVFATSRSDREYDGKLFRLIYDEAFRRLRIKVEFRVFPKKRCSMMANKGKVDGEPARVVNYNERFGNLVRVGESPVSIDFVAYSVNPAIRISSWEDLRGKGYRINYNRGSKRSHEKLTALISEEKPRALNKDIQGLGKLLKKRIDIYVGVSLSVAPLLYLDEFRQGGVRSAGVLESLPVHAFLHKRHEKLAPILSDALKKMKQEGLVEEYKANAAEATKVFYMTE